MHELLRPLQAGDRRSVRGVRGVVQRVLADPSLFAVVFAGIDAADPLLRMRCADAVEKITAARGGLLAPYRQRVIGLAAAAREKEVRWHLAQLLARLEFLPRERTRVIGILETYLGDPSSIVRTFAMQALAAIAAQDAGRREAIVGRLRDLSRTGTPAMRARGRMLLAQLSAGATAGSTTAAGTPPPSRRKGKRKTTRRRRPVADATTRGGQEP